MSRVFGKTVSENVRQVDILYEFRLMWKKRIYHARKRSYRACPASRRTRGTVLDADEINTRASRGKSRISRRRDDRYDTRATRQL